VSEELTPPNHVEVEMNILQNLFQHSKALHHLKPQTTLSHFLKLTIIEENSSSLFEGAGDRFNQTPRKPRLNLTPK